MKRAAAADAVPAACTGTRPRTRPPRTATTLFVSALCCRLPVEPKFPADVYVGQPNEENIMGKGLLLWLIGIPIPIILLIWLFGGLH